MHKWYTRPVLFVDDIAGALHFYVDLLGFEKAWHEAGGKGGVCQVARDECEIILCEDTARRDRGRLYVELTRAGIEELESALAQRSIPNKRAWWGSDVIQVEDPDGNQLLFPLPSK
jgi:catechol 2,3-dioxygenase-like lactoylglutathione lyase family enzyme